MTEKIFIIACLYMLFAFGLGVLIGRMFKVGRGEYTNLGRGKQERLEVDDTWMP